MKFARGAIGWGIVIYAVMYLVWSGLSIYGLAGGILPLLFRLLVLAVLTTIAARSLTIMNRYDLIAYTVSWAACAVALDAVFLMPFAGVAMYTSVSLWIGYALIAVIPVLTSKIFKRPAML